MQISKLAQEAARAGRKIEAIKIVRQEQSIDLKQAKEVVEDFLASTAGERDAGSGKARLGLVDTRMPEEAIEALAKGQKVEAVKIARKHFGIGLREAKQLVDRYKAEAPGEAADRPREDRNPPGVKSGCSAFAVLVALSWVAVRLLVG